METLREAVGTFDNAERLEAAIDALERAGWDRADLSVLAQKDLVSPAAAPAQHARQAADDKTAPRGAVVPEADIRQGRTLAASMAGVIAAFVATGATVVTGGGALAAVVGAAAAGGGATALVHAFGKFIGENHEDFLREQVNSGGILLWARLRDPQQEATALDILRAQGARDVHTHAFASQEEVAAQAARRRA